MKTIQKSFTKKSRLLWMAALGILTLAACTKNFEKYNTNPNALTETQLIGDGQSVGAFFSDMETSVYRIVDWEYQVQQNLNADFYSGYMMSADPFGGNNNTTYALRADWNSYPFDEAYQHVMANWRQVKIRGEKTNPDLYAVATIIKVEALHRVCDIYGPLPYTAYASAAFSVPYDSQQAVYKAFFAELDTAITTLTAFETANGNTVKPFAKFDLIYGGDYVQWIKFANSLKLRLAMHIAYADAATAQSEAESAVNNSYGTITSGAFVNNILGVNYQNSLNIITTSWGDVSMNANAESILTGYNDPRLAKYFLPSSAVAGVQKGIRLGVNYSSGTQYGGFSELGFQPTDLIQWMVPSEMDFLKAEGALRNWNMGGTAQSFYEAGIKASFAEHGISSGSDAYIADNTSTAEAYVDPTNTANNIAGVNNITIAWASGDSFEKNLQRIITQKWIAMYPDGQEAWTEQRRTGYPVLFPIANNNSGGTISSTAGIRRLPFPASEVSNNAAQVQKAISMLSGPDNGGTKLWWDAKP